MKKSVKIFIALFIILIILIPAVYGIGATPSSYKANIISPEVIPVSGVAQRSLGIVQVLGTILGFVLIPVGLVCGILYMVKSKASKGKKITLGILMIVSPVVLVVIVNMIVLASHMSSL